MREAFEIQALPDPIELFGRWYEEASACAQIADPSHVCLATLDAEGRPDARFVNIASWGAEGFAFATDVTSPKARAFASRPHAALAMLWLPLSRQVRIRGVIETAGAEIAAAQLGKRPRAGQITAWAAAQSRPMRDRRELLARHRRLEVELGGGDVPPAPTWGAYRVRPTELEFWLAREGHLCDRLRYGRRDDGAWEHRWLQPP